MMRISTHLSFTGLILLLFSAAYSRQYEVGTVYSYIYETTVLLNEPQARPVSTAKDVGFRMRLNAEVTPIWQHRTNANEQLLRITVSGSKLSVKSRQGPTPEGFVDKPSKADSFKDLPLFVYWNAGHISKVFSVKDEDTSSVNLKKGIASMLQFQVQDGQREEVDTSGLCSVQYVTSGRDKVVKIKTNCKTHTPSLYFNHTNKVLGATIDSTITSSYQLRPNDKVILKATGLETHFLRVDARKSSASEVISRQELEWKGEKQSSISQPSGATEAEVIKNLAKQTRHELVASDLSTTEDVRECIACKSLQELVSNFKGALKASSLGTQSSAIAFIRLLRKMRESTEAVLRAVLTSKKNSKILPQLLDVVALTQTKASHKVAFAFLNFREEKKILLPERYLISTSLSTHPSAAVIHDLFEMVRRGLHNNHLYETLVYTVASLVKTYSRMPGNHDKPVVREVRDYLQQELKRCDDVPCMLLYISALKTLQQRSSLPLLLSVAQTGPKKAAISAMRAVQTMPSEWIEEKMVDKIERIFLGLDRKQDSSIKIMAADLLLQQRPSEAFIERLLRDLADQKTKELNTVLLARINDQLDQDHNLREIFRKVIKNPELGNYHILGQNGLSSAFSRPLSSGGDGGANSSFTNVLEISGGLLKRSTVDVFVDTKDSRMRLLSFGIFAGGLDIFGNTDEEDADKDDDGDEPEEANAGIEITLMDTQLRPYVFFKSKSELMGHVWSGTASERTTALQGTALLHDHQQRVPLQNGFGVEMLLTGAISYDFAGQVQISIWSQNAHSLVEIGSAMVIQGQSRVDTSFVQTMIEFNTGLQTKLDFVSDLEYGGAITMCMQMSQPEYQIIENVRKLEKIPGSNYVLRKYKRRVVVGPGKTYVMNRKNTQLCNDMFNDKN